MPVTFSFGGAGRHFPFMLGVAHGLKKQLRVDWSQVYVHCISSGVSGAMALLLCTPDEIERLLLRGIGACHFTNTDYYYINVIKSMLPADAYRRLGNRLIIGHTTLPFFQSSLVTGPFQSQQQLIDNVYASCRIPFLTGTLAGRIDGGFSHQYAVFNDDTIVVTLKKKRRSDIYARDISFFSELLLPTRERMLELFALGQQLVRDNLPALQEKVNRSCNVRFAADELLLYTTKE